jgi:hypothetical protein
MPNYARADGGIVRELISLPDDGPPIGDLYHPDLVATMVEVPGGVSVSEGWLWGGATFSAPPVEPPAPEPRYIPAATLRERIEAQGKWDEVAGLLTIPQVLKLATLREGIAPDDGEMLALLTAAGVDIPAVLDGFA